MLETGGIEAAELAPLQHEPEAVVRQILASADQEEPATDLEACLAHPLFDGLTIHDEDALVKDGYLLAFADGTGRILLDANATEPRRRYTLAHEMAHWIIDRYAQFRQATTADGDQTPEAEGKEVERWCEAFAAELLMPASWVRGFVGRLEDMAKPRIVHGGPPRFGVSRAAFYHRLTELYDTLLLHRRVTSLSAATDVYPAYADEPGLKQRLRDYARQKWGEEVWEGQTGRASAGPLWVPVEDDRICTVFVFEGRHVLPGEPCGGERGSLGTR